MELVSKAYQYFQHVCGRPGKTELANNTLCYVVSASHASSYPANHGAYIAASVLFNHRLSLVQSSSSVPRVSLQL